MIEQWQELKETIIEMRDNGGTGIQQEVCRFLTNYMEILEKQMQQPCEDCISRQAVLEYIEGSEAELGHSSENELVCQDILDFPPVTPQPKIGHWIRKIVAGCFVWGCNQCGWQQRFATNFCPDCGTRMDESPESEE